MDKTFDTHSTPNIQNPMNWNKFKLAIRQDRKDKTMGRVFLDLYIHKQRWRKSLELSIKKTLWNTKLGMVEGASNEAVGLKKILLAELERANKILTEMHFMGANRTLEEFIKRYEDKTERGCFMKFLQQQAYERYKFGEISEGTYKHSMVVANKINAFTNGRGVLFADLTPDWLLRFERYDTREVNQTKVKKDSPTANTVANHLKKIKAYLAIARRMGVTNNNPFEMFKIKTVRTQREYLSESDLKKLVQLWRSDRYVNKPALKGVLTNFLMMCSTGMRVSDLFRFNRSWIKDGIVVYKPIKTKGANKVSRTPLNALSSELIASIRGQDLFYSITEQKQNEYLKVIGADAQLDQKVISNHIARHSFAALFLNKGGKIEVLQEIMAHTSIVTTMQYTHVVETEKIRQVTQAFEGL